MIDTPHQEPPSAGRAAAGPPAEAVAPARFLARISAFLGSPRGARGLTWITRALLATLLTVYLGEFGRANWGMLTDPALQNDDARTILFPFHHYGSAGTLGNDPIAEEMLSAVPWGVRLLYLALVPVFDIFLAAKVVQALAFGVLLAAAVVLTRARRTGFAAGALLVFLFLHTWFAVDRVAGGLPRAFGFPCFALWLAGVLANNRKARFSAPVMLALSYPSVMNIILAAEGLLALRGVFRVSWGVVGRRLRRYALLVGVCLVCVLPAALGGEESGPIHTLEEAEREPAFGKRGRLWVLPFAEPVEAISGAFIDPVMPRGARVLSSFDFLSREREMVAFLLLSLFLLLPLLGLSPPPALAVATFIGTCVIYALSRGLAFRLYSPERYYSFGMRMACLALLMACAAHLWFWVRPSFRESARNVTVFALVGLIWLTTGNGLSKNAGMIIDRRTDAKLYEFIRTLPQDARFGAHIMDGDGISFWGARAHTGSFETLQPWFTKSWQRQKKRTIATLGALYATDEEEVLKFADEYKVTHFLLNRARYGSGMQSKARSFEPFSTEVNQILKGKQSRELVFSQVPKSAVIFSDGRFRVVSVEKLRSAWRQQ